MASVEKLPSGNWRAVAYLGRDENGKKIRKTFTVETKWKALKAAEEYTNRHTNRLSKDMTVGDAIDSYIAVKNNILSPTSIESYKRIRNNRLQSLMDIPLNKLQVQRAVNADAARLSPKSIRSAHGLLSAALKMFMPDFALNTTLPVKQALIKNLPTPELVYETVKETDIELPCLLAMWLSLRMSEIRGLQYRDISDNVLTVQRSMVTVNGQHILKDQTKTYGSTRRLKLPEYIIALIQKPEEALDTDFIITLSGQAIYKRFTRLMKKQGITMTFHDLRHLNASIMLALGVPDKYAMERGGLVYK